MANSIWEDLGHVGLGILPLDLFLWWREWVHQWPPETEKRPVIYTVFDGEMTPLADKEPWSDVCLPYASLDRVADIGRDTLGYAIGQTIRFIGLVALIIWL